MNKKSYTSIYRIMHWAIAITMLLLLFTIFLRLTWMNKNNVSEIIQNFLSSTDQTLTEEESVLLAKKIRQPMWQWHIYLGYVLVGLFSLRFILPFFGQMKFQHPFNKTLSTKDKFKNWAYIVFYLCTTITLTTGLFLEFGPENLEETMEEIHVLALYYFIPFLVIHLSGVFIAEFTAEKGIISRIIGGGRK